MVIGVLALQGAFREHIHSLQRAGVASREVRLPGDLEGVSGLIVPGGESTTIGKLALEYGVEAEVRRRILQRKLAVWGTCAGAIWLCQEIEGYPEQPRLGLLEATVQRNAFGRQVDSFEEDLRIEGFDEPFHAIFIRAPVLSLTGSAVSILAQARGMSVLVRHDLLLASSFHPELTDDCRLHQYFVQAIVEHGVTG